MKMPLKWLKEYTNVEMTAKQLAEHLTMVGQEVESLGGTHDFDKVIIGEVLSIEKHPNADKLHLTKVNVGIKDPLQIVCGANNLSIGIRVPVVLVGGRVAGFKIDKSNLRGIESFGMICSEKELGLGDNHDGILILDQDSKVGTDFKEYLGSETVIDIKVQPNRPDCMGIWGLAREVAAGKGKLTLPNINVAEDKNEKTLELVEIQVDEPDLCPRYMARIVKGVKIGPSPKWLQDRLKSVGVRPINNVVDISNYVMFETGQPLHFFDFDKIANRGKKAKIIIRRAKKNENLTTLDGVNQKLNPDMLLISDEKNPVAVAGVMGGKNTEVNDATKNILIEAAVFDKTNIRKTSKSLNLRSEAVSRFEKGLPLTLPEISIDRAAQLLSELAGGKATKGTIDVLSKWIWIQHLGLSVAKTNKFLGIDTKNQECIDILRSLEFEADKFDIVNEAKKHLGKPYLYGANYKQNRAEAFDCSYLTDYIYSLINVQIGHTSLGQLHHGWEVKTSDLRAGDILFYKGHIDKSVTNEYHKNDGKGNHTKVLTNKYPEGVGHNGLYIGDGKVIHAAAYEYKEGKWQEKAKSGQKVEIVPVEYFTKNPEFIGVRRYVENLDNLIAVTVPWWREDVKNNADLYEEIARIWGYNNIPSTLPEMRDILPRENLDYKFVNKLRQLLASIGLTEIFTYPFVSKKDIETFGEDIKQAPRVANPLLQEQEYLRTDLIPSMLKALAENQFDHDIIQFFEISQVFHKNRAGTLPKETKNLCVGIKNDAGEKASFDMAKGIFDRIVTEFKIDEGSLPKGIWWIELISPEIMNKYDLKKKAVVLVIDLDKLQKAAPKKSVFQPISKYPYVERDISAVFNKNQLAKEILDAIKKCSQLVINAKIIDIYEGKPYDNNQKSVTVRLTLSSFDKTLTDQEIEQTINLCIKRIVTLGGNIRGGKK
ncbi:MAG: phenylalanine--tRNA ligase subunit beta [Patescibacteria group bacterium]